MEVLGKTVFAVVGLVAAAAIKGVVLSTLWAWFVVPTFALPALSIAQALGVVVVADYIRYDYDQLTESDDYKRLTGTGKLIMALASVVVMALFFLSYGWTISLFMPR